MNFHGTLFEIFYFLHDALDLLVHIYILIILSVMCRDLSLLLLLEYPFKGQLRTVNIDSVPLLLLEDLMTWFIKFPLSDLLFNK